MRFVARLAIAIATLLTSAILCWGQPPSGAPTSRRPAPSARKPAPKRTSRPVARSQFEQPAEVQPAYAETPTAEGTWVSDDGNVQTPQPPEQLGIEPFQLDESGYSPTMGCNCPECQAAAAAAGECDGCCDDGSCDADGAGAGGLLGHRRLCGGAGICGPLWCSDLWNDVHAHRRVFFEVDYLSYWTKGNPLPPLVTTSPLGTPQSQAGVLPVSATTAILFGNERVDDQRRNGGRINVGYWLVDGEFLGIEGQYFALEEAKTKFLATSNFSGGDPNAQILARPFFNVDPNLITPRQDAAIIAFPDGFVLGQGTGTLDGSIKVRTTGNLQSAGALLRRLVWIDFTMQRRLDLLLGYRFFRLDDSVTINDQSTFIPTSGPIPLTEFASQDQFSSRNEFHGGEIGAKFQSHHGRLSIELIGKCAFGNNQQRTVINGSNTVTSGGGAPVENVGGLLAQPTNIGTHTRNVFAVLPEANTNLRWDITCNLRATLGYNFLYINRVQRSGDAIDTTLNPTQINGGTLVGEARPAFFPTDTTWWAHGASGGLEYRW